MWLALTLADRVHLEGGFWLQDWIDEVWIVLAGSHKHACQVDCHTLEGLQSILSGPKLEGPFLHAAGPHGFLDMR